MKLVSKISSGFVTKYKFMTNDNYIIENVYVDRPEKNIICLSSLIGCSINCKFCKAEEFIRSITLEELEDQFQTIKKYINNRKLVLVSFMGVGDITLNSNASKILQKFSTIADKVAFSTIVPSITAFAFLMLNIKDLSNLKIQFSVHSLDPKERKYIFGHDVPLYHVSSAITFLKQLNFTNFELNYMLIDNVNDSLNHSKKLSETFGKYYIKLNRYNETISEFKYSKREQTFLDDLLSSGCQAELYQTDGQDIAACCGQLTNSL
jgi:23S rRNA (adenine2503-C2)-methyltransferase